MYCHGEPMDTETVRENDMNDSDCENKIGDDHTLMEVSNSNSPNYGKCEQVSLTEGNHNTNQLPGTSNTSITDEECTTSKPATPTPEPSNKIKFETKSSKRHRRRRRDVML